MSHELKAIPNLPDEREYPAELIERYELDRLRACVNAKCNRLVVVSDDV